MIIPKIREKIYRCPQKSEVRDHLISFRANDMELEMIDRRYAEISFKNRDDFCRYSALTVMNVEEDLEGIKQIARYISSISNSFDQIAHRGVLCVNRLNTLLMKIRLEIIRFLKLLCAW